MGTDYYFVCKKCQKRKPAFYRQAWGIYNDPGMILNAAKFVAFHTLFCNKGDLIIVSEHEIEDFLPLIWTDQDRTDEDFSKNTEDGKLYNSILSNLDGLPKVWNDYCQTCRNI